MATGSTAKQSFSEIITQVGNKPQSKITEIKGVFLLNIYENLSRGKKYEKNVSEVSFTVLQKLNCPTATEGFQR